VMVIHIQIPLDTVYSIQDKVAPSQNLLFPTVDHWDLAYCHFVQSRVIGRTMSGRLRVAWQSFDMRRNHSCH